MSIYAFSFDVNVNVVHFEVNLGESSVFHDFQFSCFVLCNNFNAANKLPQKLYHIYKQLRSLKSSTLIEFTHIDTVRGTRIVWRVQIPQSFLKLRIPLSIVKHSKEINIQSSVVLQYG